jgi:hypothetical protein
MIHRVITVQVPESRRVVVELPPEVPVGSAQLEVRVIGTNDTAVEVPPPKIDVAGLPTYIDKRSGERRLVGRSGVVREVRSAE